MTSVDVAVVPAVNAAVVVAVRDVGCDADLGAGLTSTRWTWGRFPHHVRPHVGHERLADGFEGVEGWESAWTWNSYSIAGQESVSKWEKSGQKQK